MLSAPVLVDAAPGNEEGLLRVLLPLLVVELKSDRVTGADELLKVMLQVLVANTWAGEVEVSRLLLPLLLSLVLDDAMLLDESLKVLL